MKQTSNAYVSRYALGRDYHKVVRQKLKKLANKLQSHCVNLGFDNFNSRIFTDSAPILEKALAEKSGLGWIGKNTLLINEKEGSWFFLGEILVNLPLTQSPEKNVNRCGSCSSCIDICPTKAIVAPYTLDARRCISYLTIEFKGVIPLEFRRLIGNRIFGCDDCQLTCPWNRYAKQTLEPDFEPRHGLDDGTLLELFEWTKDEFLKKTEGSAIRRAGYESWLRNLAIGLGNINTTEHVQQKKISRPMIIAALKTKLGYSSLVDHHIAWAITQHQESTNSF